MKSLFKLLLLSISLVASSIGATPSKTESGITKIVCTPFYLNEKMSYVSLSVNATRTERASIKVSIVNDLYPDGIIIFTKMFSTSSKVDVEYNNEYTRPIGNSIVITQTINRATTTIKHDIEAVVSNAEVVNESPYEYTSTSNFYTWLSITKKWKTSKEVYVMTNFEEFYMPNYYHKIDISDFKITYKTTSGFFNMRSGLLAITNLNGSFDSFEHDKKYAYFPIVLVGTSSNYNLSFENKFYVDPMTLIMSPVPKDGYVETKNLYLPRNEKRSENNYDCMLTLDGLGQDNTKFLSRFKYKSTLNILGDCRNSEYCIANK